MSSKGSWDQVSGKWMQLKGEVRRQWGKLTDDEIDEIKGNRQKLMGKIQEKYGVAENEANREIDEWAERLKY
jgi:uncharacterized protein YjbJ (UPF0337 family)